MATGDFIKKPDRRFKLLILIQGLWAVTLIVLALWWGTLLRQQSDEIANLQTQLGTPEHQVQTRLDRTERMVTGESSTFVILILVTNGILLFFFARDTKRSRSLEAFFASITHELRTPLTSIRLQAETLKDMDPNPKQAPFLGRLLEDVSRLEAQVQETLELARIEGGGEINLQSIPLNGFLEKRILPNYISDPNGVPTQILIAGKNVGTTYALSVEHQNSAFEAEHEKLGQLFYRGKNSQGAGIGLYLVETLMAKMGGSASFLPQNETFSAKLSFKLEKSERNDA